MRLVRLFLLSLVLFVPASTQAQIISGGSLHLAWDDCYYGGAGGGVDKTFSCGTNAGAARNIFASVIPPAGLTQFVGALCVFDLRSATVTLPLWWTFQTGGCRLPSSLTAAPAAGVTSCPDLTDNPQFGGIDYALGLWGPGHARLRTVYAMDAGLAHPVSSTDEVTALQISINNSRTTGAGSCIGCNVPVCLVFNSMLLDQVDPFAPRGLVTTGEQNFVTWQGSSAQVPCPAATPTQSRTWGQVKSLYR